MHVLNLMHCMSKLSDVVKSFILLGLLLLRTETGGQSVMADLEQSFMRSMSLRGVNYGGTHPQVCFLDYVI